MSGYPRRTTELRVTLPWPEWLRKIPRPIHFLADTANDLSRFLWTFGFSHNSASKCWHHATAAQLRQCANRSVPIIHLESGEAEDSPRRWMTNQAAKWWDENGGKRIVIPRVVLGHLGSFVAPAPIPDDINLVASTLVQMALKARRAQRKANSINVSLDERSDERFQVKALPGIQ